MTRRICAIKQLSLQKSAGITTRRHKNPGNKQRDILKHARFRENDPELATKVEILPQKYQIKPKCIENQFRIHQAKLKNKYTIDHMSGEQARSIRR